MSPVVHVDETGGNVAPCTKEPRPHVKRVPVDFVIAYKSACKIKKADEHCVVADCAPCE